MTKSPLFQVGAVLKLDGGESRVDSYDGTDEQGREVYTVTTTEVRVISGHPVNRFKAVVIPTLTITGCA